ncbi:MAG: hypothetical protein AAB926_00395 [Patescibacteria group bacterium]
MIGELEKWLTRLIAERAGVPEEKVTCEWIEEQRKKKIYPKVRFSVGSDYSGYGAGLLFLTGEEWEEVEKEADRILEEMLNET